ncbi:SRPBCC family protein [Nocardia sp. NPDC004711]
MSNREFTLVRVFDAPRDLVFRAWIEPDQIAEWAGPHGFTTRRDSIVAEPVPGGRYESIMVSDTDGTEYRSVGTFREIVEPERLVFTWGDPTGDGGPERDSVITVTFADAGDGKTAMNFHLRAPGPLSPDDSAAYGWGQSLDRLAHTL